MRLKSDSSHHVGQLVSEKLRSDAVRKRYERLTGSHKLPPVTVTGLDPDTLELQPAGLVHRVIFKSILEEIVPQHYRNRFTLWLEEEGELIT